MNSKQLSILGVCICLILVLVIPLFTACSSAAPSSSPAQSQPAAAQAKQTWQWKLSHPTPETTIHQFNALNVAKLVNQYTDGRVTITVYPNAQLFQVNEDPTGLLSGAIQMSASYPQTIASIAPLTRVLDLPLLFDYSYADWSSIKKFLEGPGGDLCNQALMEKGFISPGNGFLPTDVGCSIGNNVRVIRSVEDVKGIKIRIPGGGYLQDGLKILGMSPTAMASSEVQTALSQGVIEGVFTTPIYQYDSNFRPKYILLDMMVVSESDFLMSKIYYDSLPADIQQGVAKGIREARTLAYAEVDKRGKDRLDRMAKEWGTQTNNLSKEELSRWRKLMQPTFDDYLKIDKRSQQVLDLAAAANRK